jgi:hypothetical protein
MSRKCGVGIDSVDTLDAIRGGRETVNISIMSSRVEKVGVYYFEHKGVKVGEKYLHPHQWAKKAIKVTNLSSKNRIFVDGKSLIDHEKEV